jgi:hypothetical protein
MNSNGLRALFWSACLSGAAITAVRAGGPEAAFVSAAFPAPPAPAALEIAGPLTGDVARVLGHAYPSREVSYWRADDKTVWVLQGLSKSHPFTAGFVVEQGRIAKSEILVYRESRGREIRSQRFLRQFTGAALRDGLGLDRRIDGITGATISATAAHNLARLALIFDAFVRGRDGPGGDSF